MIFRKQSATDGLPAEAALIAEIERLQAERHELIKLCLYARDRLDSEAAARRVDEGLEQIGITALVPDGQPFDPAGYEASAVIETADPGLHDTVAETELPGYTDRGVVVREPVVSVYRRPVVGVGPVPTSYDAPAVSEEAAREHALPDEPPAEDNVAGSAGKETPR